ncbi:hypothetical protein ACFQ4E_18235, partial [Litorisediminicola beolgyonensis]
MSPRLVIHIGDPKTGTSSIQRVLMDGAWQAPGLTMMPRAQLNDYPLANTLRKAKQRAKLEPRFTALARQIAASEADLAVVSAEQFWGVDPKALYEALRRFLPEHAESARVIAYVRPHAAHFLSGYAQSCKTGHFQGDGAAYLAHVQTGRILNCAPRFLAWRDTFGDRFTLRLFDRARLSGGDAVRDFLETATGRTDIEITAGAAQNETLTRPALAGVMLLQQRLDAAGIPQEVKTALGGEMAGLCNRGGGMGGEKLALDRALATRIAARFAEDAAALDAAFFP